MRLCLLAALALPVLAQAAPGPPPDSVSAAANHPTVAPTDDPQGTYTRTVKRLFRVDGARGTVVLDNRYGDIDYRTWDRAEVRVAVTITARAASESRAAATFDRIDIHFFQRGDHVAATTQVARQSGWNFFGDTDDGFEIDYAVSAPKGLDLEIANRYGDVNLVDLGADLEVDLRYGDLRGGDVAGATVLEVGYGEASLGRVGEVTAEVRYGKLALGTAGDVRLDSRYSEMDFGAVGTLTLESRYDDFAIRSLGRLTNTGRYDEFDIGTLGTGDVDTRYTDIAVGHLRESARMNLQYGDARIGGTGPELRAIALEGRYTDLFVRLAPRLRYGIEARGHYTDIELPRGLTIVRKENVGARESYRAHTGDDAGEATVELVGSYGSIRVE